MCINNTKIHIALIIHRHPRNPEEPALHHRCSWKYGLQEEMHPLQLPDVA